MFGNSFQIKYVCTEVTTQKSRVAGGSTAKTLVSHEVVGRGLGLLLRDLNNEIVASTDFKLKMPAVKLYFLQCLLKN